MTPKTLTVTECHQFINELLCKDGSQIQFAQGIRNYTMSLLMLDAGLRVGEVVQLKVSDLLYNSEPTLTLIVRPEIAKLHIERTVPTSSRLRNSIVSMLEKIWFLSTNYSTRFAFYSTNPERHISVRTVQKIFESAGNKSIGRPVKPHSLRHTFGSRLMRKANARIVQELLGHKHLSSTQIYTHPNGDDLKSAIESIAENP